MASKKTTTTTATTIPNDAGPPPAPPALGGSSNPLGGVPPGYQVNGQAPRYNSGDEFAAGNNVPPAQVYQRQRDLESAGLLAPGSYRPGTWDDSTSQAWGIVLGYANRWGTDDSTALQRLITNPLPTSAAQAHIAEPLTHKYQPTDPADLDTALHSAFQSALRRDPSAAEYAAFKARYLTNERTAAFTGFNAEDANRQQYIDALDAQSGVKKGAKPGKEGMAATNSQAGDQAAIQAEMASEDKVAASIPGSTKRRLLDSDRQAINTPTSAADAQWQLAQHQQLPSQQAAASVASLPTSTTTVLPSVANPSAAAFDEARLNHPVEYAATQVAKSIESFFQLLHGVP